MHLPKGSAPYALLATLAAAGAPLAAYTVSLAIFGAWHVHVELGWVRERWRGSLRPLVAPLLVIAGLRLAGWAGHAPAWAVAAELALGVGLILAVLGRLPGWRTRALGAALGALLIAGIVLAPVPTLVVFALLHNFTPLGFFADRGLPLRGPVLAFLGLPALAAALVALAEHGGVGPGGAWAGDPLGAGPIAGHHAAFVPAGLPAAATAPLFAAAVTGQLLHYGAVIGVMGGWRRELARPRELAAAGLALGLGLYFAASFGDARRLYGAVAAIHSWIELPVLLLALGAPRHQASHAPSAADPALAASDTASARPGDSTTA